MKSLKRNKPINKTINNKKRITIIIASIVFVLGVIGAIATMVNIDKSSEKQTEEKVASVTNAQMVNADEITDTTELTTELTTEILFEDEANDTITATSSNIAENSNGVSSEKNTEDAIYESANTTTINDTYMIDESTELYDECVTEQYGSVDSENCEHYFIGLDGEKVYYWEENVYGVHHEAVYETVEYTEEVPIIEHHFVSQCKSCSYVGGYVLAPGQNSDVPYPWDDFNEYLWVEADTESYSEHVDNSGTEIIILWEEEHEVNVCRNGCRTIGIDVVMGYETVTTTEEVLVSEEWTEIIHTGEWYCGHCGAKKE